MRNKLDMKLDILKIIERERNVAREGYIKYVAENAAMIAAANVWDDFNKNDGVGAISMNPYNSKISSTEKIMDDYRKRYNDLIELYQYATVTFLES